MPVSRRKAMHRGGAILGVLAATVSLELFDEFARVPYRLAWATAAFPDVQFDLSAFVPPASTVDGVAVSLPPVFTGFVTARLDRLPTKADQGRMENALASIEANYPYTPAGVFTHVAYSDNYFARLPRTVVTAHMPRTLDGGQPVLKRAVAGPTDVAPGSRTLALRRPEFAVPLRLENNDILFTVRADNADHVNDVVKWLAGSNQLAGRQIGSPRFDAGMTFTSTRAMFVQVGLPRSIADRERLPFASFVNPFAPMWMGFADQQVDASAPAPDVTFAGAHGIKLTTAEAGDYFDNGAIQHLSHVLLDLQQFYLDGDNQDEPAADHREQFSERVQYMFQSPPSAEQDPQDPYRDGGGPRGTDSRGGILPNVFRGADYARSSAQQFGRVGHVSALHRSGRTADGRPVHLRIDGPGFDAMDTTSGHNAPKLQFSGFFPSADFFEDLRRNQASIDLLDEFALDEEEHGLERFITTTRRQNFLMPPRRHRAFPLVELA
ncbi:DUF7405 family protein [Amycolatopsis sp. H20-H5]|uniref:DUF7405 family protein n=1 Tax=Amycolatopsis sp. H20-H5 TaxID=3046309 RepID=UPI002DBEB217|nr:hypothetical protein [Amycolatopsis sp. H20-H5]MEC3980458.1 hypothetical protein [Amycolatopsis sp. H20-H5]